MHHPYRYFIAAGESLEAIGFCITEEEVQRLEDEALRLKNKTRLDDFLERFNISGREIRMKWSRQDEQGKSALMLAFNDPSLPVLEGWKWHQTENDFCIPDVDTEAGRTIKEELDKIWDNKDAQYAFARWLKADRVDTAPGAMSLHVGFSANKSAGFEKIGDDYIISVPVVSYEDGEDWIMPPDSVPITVSEYFRRQEAAGNLSNAPTSKNHMPFNQEPEVLNDTPTPA